MRRTMRNTRYTVIAMDTPQPDSLYGTTPKLTSDHVIIGHRKYMESAANLMDKTRDAVNGYPCVFVRDNEDGMVVNEAS